MTIKDCSACGGTHYGSYKCPFLVPCVVCGDETVMRCSDCSIDSGGRARIAVCTKSECRDEHEKIHPDVVHMATDADGGGNERPTRS